MDVDQLGPDGLADLRRVVDGRWADVRAAVREQLPPEWCRPVGDLDREAQRAVTLERAKVLAGWDLPRRGFEKAYGGEDDIGGSMTLYEMLGLVDLSLMVKAGVQWGLFGGALQALGTRKHHERYLPQMMTLELPGCFAMTESGHGSDVQSLRTTATYDVERQDFVISTPDDDARKDYIGNAARDGRIAVVFAQLVTQGESHGVHAVLVPIRDERGEPCPGVRIEDCGHKGGLNGVDNGRLWFDDVRVPRDALLDRYGQVAAGRRVCDLYVLAEVESDRGWFLEHGRLTPALSKAVGRAVDDLAARADAGRRAGRPQEWLAAEVAEPSRS